MLPASCMGCCVCPSCSSFSHLPGLLSAPRALLKRLVVFSAHHLQLNNVPPGTPATVCLYLPFSDGDTAYYILHLPILLFIPSPRRFQWRVLPLTGCTTAFRIRQCCWCPITIGALKTLSEGTGGRVVFLPVALQAFPGKLNVSFPTSAESLSGYVNVYGRGQRVLETPSESLDPTCSGFPGPPEPF